MKHYIVILSIVDDFTSSVDVLGVFHEQSDAQVCFNTQQSCEKTIAESNNYVTDIDEGYFCGYAEGDYNNNHRVLQIVEK